MTSPSGENPHCSRCHGTPECWPVPDPAVVRHAVVPGGTAKAGDTTSTRDLGEAHVNGASRYLQE